MLTTESDQEKKERARKLGATGFIIKPFNPTGLVDDASKSCGVTLEVTTETIGIDPCLDSEQLKITFFEECQ